MKERLSAIAVGLAVVLGLSSCFEAEQTLTLKKDGSGTITEEMMMGPQMVAMMTLAQTQAPDGAEVNDPMAEMMDEAQYKEKAKGYGEGVEFVKVEKIERDGGMGVKAHYKFADINKLAFSPGSNLDGLGDDGPDAGDAEENEPLKFNYADGKLTITFPDPPEGESAELKVNDEPVGPEAQQMMAMFKDMKVGVRMVFEPGIAKTNASHVDGDSMALMEMNFGEILQNPEGVQVLQKLDMQDRDKMAAALKDVKGVKVETKKTVEVTLK